MTRINKLFRIKHLLMTGLLLTAMGLLSVSGQRVLRINLLGGGSMIYKKELGKDLKRIIGSVEFEHDGAHLYCDSAYFYEETNNVDCYGKVRIKVSDTLNIYGDVLKYDGNTKMADLIGNVKMVDKQTTLTTNHLIYDRNTGIAYYSEGATILGKDNKLTSTRGYYYTDKKEFFFKDRVVLVNPRYTVNSDTLMYNTASRVAFFKGPSTITSKENFIYCENGWYNTVSDISQFKKNAYLKNKGQRIAGDSLFYDRKRGFGRAIRHVSIRDTVKDVIITGNYGVYEEKKGYSVMTDSAVGTMIDKDKPMYIHADTLMATFDSLQKSKALFAYHHAKIYRADLQGMCDSILYDFRDSTVTMFHQPVLWSEDNQLTADTIRLWMTHQEADSMMLYHSCFVVSKQDSLKYNQIKGKKMVGHFYQNELRTIMVTGNAETIYFAREDNGKPIGMNLAFSGEMLITLKERKISKIKYIGKPDATLIPEKEVKAPDRLLKGFSWLEAKRPKSRADIFSW